MSTSKSADRFSAPSYRDYLEAATNVDCGEFTVQQFRNGDYFTVLKDTVIDAMGSHKAMAEQVMGKDEVFAGLAELLLAEVYNRLRGEASPKRL